MNESTQAITAASKPGGELIADSELCDLVRTRGRTLLELARSLAAMRAAEVCLTRPLIGRLLLESGQMETLLDADLPAPARRRRLPVGDLRAPAAGG